ncbi:MAG: 50S ribosomal protein L32e [Candidatus Thermoplasmatota archaeon]|nr:50S ribosomal protein L32e [Candidatus Thermoplasmatota archaeon]
MATEKKVAKEANEKVEEKEEVIPPTTSKRKKIKPQLDEDTRASLEKRKERYDVQPHFKRGEWFRYKKLGMNWKRPRAVTNKQRKNLKYRPSKVRIGFGKPSNVRGLHPSGFIEVSVHRVEDLEGLDPRVQAGRIGATVGTRKRRSIVEAADAKGIRILNRGAL